MKKQESWVTEYNLAAEIAKKEEELFILKKKLRKMKPVKFKPKIETR